VLTRQRNVSEKERRVGARNGTRVVARDMFGNLPVRTKQRAVYFGIVDNVERALDRLKWQITALALAWSKAVRIVVSDQVQQKRKFAIGKKANACGYDPHPTREWQKTSAFRLDHICTLLSDAGYINPTDFDSWTSVSARTSQIFVRAAISLEPAPSKQVQFISLGIRPLDSSSALSQVLYREVNLLFAESAFGSIEDDLDIPEEEYLRRLRDRRYKVDGPTGRQLKGKGKGADRFPMFYIRISPRDEDIPLGLLGSDEDDNHAAKFLEKTLLLISSMVHHFLQDRRFRPRARQRTSGLLCPRKRTANSQPSTPSRDCSYPTKPVASSHEESKDHTTNGREYAHATIGSKAQSKVSQKMSSAIPFGSWSRIKSGQPGALNDLLSGLPSSKRSHDLQRSSSEPKYHAEHSSSLATHGVRYDSLTAEHLKEDIELVLRDLDEAPYLEGSNQPNVIEHESKIAPQLEVSEQEEESCRLGLDNFEDNIIFWHNPTSGDFIRVNARTGLSLPDLPSRPSSESKLSTSNLTNPNSSSFRGSLRHRSSDSRILDLSAGLQSESNTWLGGLMRGWQNPAFHLKESPIPSVVLDHIEETHDKSKKCCHGQYSHCIESEIVSRKGRLSKAALRDATILGQVDKKFILAIMRASETDKVTSMSDDTALVLIDQHAADERCRVEDLYEEISNTTAMRLPKPITFEVTQRELELFRRERTGFESWGVLYKVGVERDTTKNTQAVRPASAHLPSAKRLVDQDTNKRPTTASFSRPPAVVPRDTAKGSSLQIVVHALPELIAERCRHDPKMLIEILRSEVWARTESTTRVSTLLTANERSEKGAEEEFKAHSWLKRISGCPRGLIDLLNSRACRSAIMFNDELTQLECEGVVRTLAKCAFPFRCAHGRPSMVVLGALESRAMQLPKDDGADMKKGQATRSASHAQGSIILDFLPAFTAWQQSVG
jgi:DNA mismatch repair protein MLH3